MGYNIRMQNNDFKIILFYKFTDIADPEALREAHYKKCQEIGIKGRMLVAHEGINGTFEGTPVQLTEYKNFVHSDPGFADVLFKESPGTGTAFPKLTIKVRDEVVTLGKTFSDVKALTATELSAEELQKWYKNDEDFVVLDLRNDYEIKCGKFERTIDPGLQNFRDLGDKLQELKDLKNKKVVTVCTGGIRCEKATCLMKEEGFENLYQLKDGIHTYMQKYPGEHFKGTLFVFDNRMTTDVVETPNKEIIGECVFCGIKSENYCSDDSVRPSRKIICCENCFLSNKSTLRESTTLST